MTTDRQTVFLFLNVTESLTTIDRSRLEKIRSDHANLVKNETSTTTTVSNTDDQLKVLADKLMLVNNASNLDLLKICVSSRSLELACQELLAKYIDALLAEKRNARKVIQPSVNILPKPIVTESLSEVTCQIFIKRNQPALIEFIDSFLLSPLDQNTSTKKSKEEHNSSGHKRLLSGSVLDVFIRHKLSSRSDINVGRLLTKFPLVNPITLVDEFDTWYFDHLHGLFELNLIPENETFPFQWKFLSDGTIFYRIDMIGQIDDNQEEKIRNVDRPSTASLQQFVQDVCEKENNGMTTKWLEALRIDDIFTYDHLANLKYTEWSELKALSMNGKKILKSYVDREKQMSADVKSNTKSNENQNNEQTQSKCELFANIHQIRLYFHYILIDQFNHFQIAIPAKLDVRCAHLAFDEMRQDGFADDGLFDQMKIFFLPLTIVEKDLSINDIRSKTISKNLLKEHDQLVAEQHRLVDKLTEKEDEYYRHDDSIRKLKQNKHIKKPIQLNENEEKFGEFTDTQLIERHRKDMECLEKVRNDLRTQIKATEDLLINIEQNLLENQNENENKTNRDLIKPNRGFIMYGPPGTGKSDIMSKLSTRIGIKMVAPPIAAGELNRPLVGESERIISDICMRCHRIPYLMCCVSIDEIDSLTPKRKDDSSDGNVAKLSVLLSVIDGIKDVPNLMIFCATNRLHMMDEAFLRRMQGKFFVGRPSSLARKSILSGMKHWHMPPHLLESLTIATTNFSGAALRALRRSITVHCVDAERRNPNYALDYRTMLQLADKTARDYRILIGAETLPTLLMRTTDEQHRSGAIKNYHRQPPTPFDDLPNKPNCEYTGKIIINFHAQRIDIEMINIDQYTREREKFVYQEDLLDTEKNLQALIQRLTVYGKSRNVQLLQLIDLNLLSTESAYDEKEKFEILKERLDECQAYRRSMIVYDLDSLIGVNRSEGNSSMGRSTNFSLINHNIYTYIKEKFQNAHIEIVPSTNIDLNSTYINEEKWAVMVIRDPFLVRQFCDDINFTRSVREIEEEEAEIRRMNEKIKCVQCNDFYIEQDNKMGVCVHHDGFVYDNHSLTLTQWGQRAAMEQLLKEEAETVKQPATTPEQKEKLEREKQRFKYICCNQTVQTAGIMGGCKRGKHSSANMSQNEWDYACDTNKEYVEKRINLLERRIHS